MLNNHQKRATGGGCWLMGDMRDNHIAWVEEVAKAIFYADVSIRRNDEPDFNPKWDDDKTACDEYRYRALSALRAARVNTILPREETG